ncbi:polysaccharide deacetylase family protein [Parvularcula sp. ZS-1/3]|uniref:Chitooligosaccharide deacetylase n=1 Tax=Parvularcula mediterranea TaxID=2732508 RepID=A0A7Y3RL48_9PROT|nr:polysaccharide deacetylase family protein [Parvularcula mediterranea]NNU15521.1 polysaccharide deacetylase family protein [Parvularcula mediterranea]
MNKLLPAALALLTSFGLAHAEEGKRIAITFDDAPRSDSRVMTGDQRTELFLSSLAKAEMPPATIFVTTRGIEQLETGHARVKAYADAGHLIANHSHSHPWLSRTPLETYLADLDKAEELLTGFANRRAWFRFPFLDEERQDKVKRDAMRKALADRGLFSGYVTVDTYDWHMESRWQQAVRDGLPVDKEALKDAYVAMVVEASEHYHHLSEEWLDRQPAHVLLLHENDLAANFIDEAIDALRAKGWEIISADEAYADPIATKLPDTLFAGMGRVSALAYERGARGSETFDHWSADEDGINNRLAELGAIPKPD